MRMQDNEYVNAPKNFALSFKLIFATSVKQEEQLKHHISNTKIW